MGTASPSGKRIVLVTGGGGFLGTALVRLLISRGETVRSFSRKHHEQLESWGVEQIQGDIGDSAAVEKACRNVEVVFHTAAKTGIWGKYQDYYGPNVAGTKNILESCRRCGVRRLIYTSSPSVVFDGSEMRGVDESAPYPSFFHAPYPRTKAMAEQMVLQAATGEGPAAIALRPHLIWGPGDPHMAPRIIARAHRLRQVGDGTNLVDTIYVDNAAYAHVLAEECLMNKPHLSGRVYFISQDQPIGLWEMINRILAAGGKPPITKTISPAAAYIAGMFFEGLYAMLRIRREPPMTRFVARELATSHWFDIRAAKTDLGYDPPVSIETGLERLAEWLRV